MIVNDDVGILTLIRIILERVSNDVRMPAIDDIELCRQFRQSGVTENTSVIMLSAMAKAESVEVSSRGKRRHPQTGSSQSSYRDHSTRAEWAHAGYNMTRQNNTSPPIGSNADAH